MPKPRGSKSSKTPKESKEAHPKGENREEKTPQHLTPSPPSSPSTTPSVPSQASATVTRSTVTPSPPSAPSDEQPDQRVRSPREIAAITRIYRALGSMEKTADFFGISVATVSKYCSGIQVPPEVRERAQTSDSNESTPHASELQDRTDDGDAAGGDDGLSEEYEKPQPPRLSYEIRAKRPRVYEPNGEPDEAEKPPIMRSNNRYDDWDEIVSQVRAASWSARYRGSAADFYAEFIVPDLQIADLCKTYAGTSDPEVVKEVLATVWKKSLLMDRLQRDTGLAGVDGRRQKEPLQS